MNYIKILLKNQGFKILLIVIVLDCIFGILRAIKQRKLNSTIGIDGLIRKTGMILSIVFLYAIDYIMNLDFIFFIPETIKKLWQIDKIGIGGMFSILFISFEFLSIFKNMIICKLPIPKKLQNYCEKILKEFTEEIK